jgi:hypothetical protein
VTFFDFFFYGVFVTTVERRCATMRTVRPTMTRSMASWTSLSGRKEKQKHKGKKIEKQSPGATMTRTASLRRKINKIKTTKQRLLDMPVCEGCDDQPRHRHSFFSTIFFFEFYRILSPEPTLPRQAEGFWAVG